MAWSPRDGESICFLAEVWRLGERKAHLVQEAGGRPRSRVSGGGGVRAEARDVGALPLRRACKGHMA